MPIAFYDEDTKTLVRMSPPCQINKFVSTATNYLTAIQNAIRDSNYAVMNYSDDSSVLVFRRWPKVLRGLNKLDTIESSAFYAKCKLLYPSTIILDDDSDGFLIANPSDVVMFRLVNPAQF